MSRTVGKKTYTVHDIWLAYVKHLLAITPGAYTKYGRFRSHDVVKVMDNGVEREMMSYNRFRKVIEHYFDRAKKAIIQGEALDMTNGVGKILGCMVERDFTRAGQRRINWAATKKLSETVPKIWDEQKQRFVYAKLVYYTNDNWCRIKWHKHYTIENETKYEFKPTAPNRDKSGFTKEFSDALMADPLLKFRYLFNPAIIR